MGVGVIVRNDFGVAIATMCLVVPFITDPAVAEVVALWRAVTLCVEMDMQRIHLEGDAKEIIQALQCQGPVGAEKEKGAVTMPKSREKEKVAIAKKLPRTTNSTSSEQAINSVPSKSIPTASYQTSKVEVKIEIVESSPGDKINYIRDKLYLAALKGDWPSAKKLHKENPGPKIWERPISQEEMNALQIAIAAKQTAFATELLECMDATQLEIKNATGDTALAITARSGSVKIATKLVKKNEKLPMIRNKQKQLPLLIAAIHRQRDMVLYLYGVTSFEQLTQDECIKLFLHVIPCDLFGIANEMLINNLRLATAADENGRIALEEFARKPFAIGSRDQMSAWERCIGYC